MTIIYCLDGCVKQSTIKLNLKFDPVKSTRKVMNLTVPQRLLQMDYYDILQQLLVTFFQKENLLAIIIIET